MSAPLGIAIIGCGYVADYYMSTLAAYPQLNLRGCFDKDARRGEIFSQHYQVALYPSFDEVLKDPAVSLIINLTNPRAHYSISRQCLLAGKHVYSEKPLAMDLEQARELVALAEEKALQIVSAPCSVLGKTAKTLAHAVQQDVCGKVRLVYAELDDGMVHQMPYRQWLSETGAPWPYRDEFEVGCTLEHAGYVLAWLVHMFGPVATVTAFSDVLIADKVPGEAVLEPATAADTSIGVLKFESGVVARLTTTIVAPHDHAIKIFGDKGVLSVTECWDNSCKVYLQKFMRIRRKYFLTPWKKQHKLPVDIPVHHKNRGNTKMDFLLGVAEIAGVIQSGQPSFFDASFSLHVNEVTLALQYAGEQGSLYTVQSQIVPQRK